MLLLLRCAVVCAIALRVHAVAARYKPKPRPQVITQCQLSDHQRSEIFSYEGFVHNLYEYVVNGTERGATFRRVAAFTDDFGPRFTGTQALEKAIDKTAGRLRNSSLENVHTEEVKVPHWVRGDEFAYMLLPRKQKLAILGLGGSVGTPEEGVVAEIIVVKTFEELKRNANDAAGKIVVFDQDYTTYQESAKYRAYGAREAARVGAVAALVRSVTPFSIYTVHAGLLSYDLNVTQIPSAAITVEDAAMLRRLYQRGHKVTIQLHMEARNLPYAISRNIIAEITGREKPKEVVLVGGHIDSWDIGQGALDDGGGAVLATRVLRILQHMGFRPRRTIRLVLWTGEEVGRIGRHAYIRQHSDQATNIKLVLNTETGTTRPRGLNVHAAKPLYNCLLREVVKLYDFMGANSVREKHGKQIHDSDDFNELGISVAAMENKDERYFYYHHSLGDTISVLDSHLLDLATAFWTGVAYIVSDLAVLP